MAGVQSVWQFLRTAGAGLQARLSQKKSHVSVVTVVTGMSRAKIMRKSLHECTARTAPPLESISTMGTLLSSTATVHRFPLREPARAAEKDSDIFAARLMPVTMVLTNLEAIRGPGWRTVE